MKILKELTGIGTEKLAKLFNMKIRWKIGHIPLSVSMDEVYFEDSTYHNNETNKGVEESKNDAWIAYGRV